MQSFVTCYQVTFYFLWIDLVLKHKVPKHYHQDYSCNLSINYRHGNRRDCFFQNREKYILIGVFTTLSNIYDRAYLLKAINYYHTQKYLDVLIGSEILLGPGCCFFGKSSSCIVFVI